MIHVIASIELHVGQRSAFLMELHKIVPLVRAEVGCHEYTPTVDVETSLPTGTAPRDNLVVIVERWETLDHLEAHLIAPHMLEYRPKVKAMIDRVSLQILESVASQP